MKCLSWIVFVIRYYPSASFRWLFRKPNRVLVLVDGENIEKEVPVEEGMIVDYKVLMNQCLEYGHIDFAFYFHPEHRRAPFGIRDLGFDVVSCSPGRFDHNNNCEYRRIKEKDKVDSNMIRLGWRMIDRMKGVTHLILVARDGDYVHLVNHARLHGIKVVAFGKNNFAFALKQVVDIQHPTPLKDKK